MTSTCKAMANLPITLSIPFKMQQTKGQKYRALQYGCYPASKHTKNMDKMISCHFAHVYISDLYIL